MDLQSALQGGLGATALIALYNIAQALIKKTSPQKDEPESQALRANTEAIRELTSFLRERYAAEAEIAKGLHEDVDEIRDNIQRVKSLLQKHDTRCQVVCMGQKGGSTSE